MRPPESFIAQPIRSLQTMLRVISEIDKRIPTVVPDGIYGSTNQQAVTAFQRQHGLPATGVVNQDTWEHIVTSYENAFIEVEKAQPIEILLDTGDQFTSGDSDPYIYLMQTMLYTILEDQVSIKYPITGTMDEETIKQLKRFQELSGISETGTLDKTTWKHLSLHFTAKAHRLKASRNSKK